MQNHVPYNKMFISQAYTKVAEVVGDFTLACKLQGKEKLHLGIETPITARSLESTIINYIYSYSP